MLAAERAEGADLDALDELVERMASAADFESTGAPTSAFTSASPRPRVRRVWWPR